MSQDSSEKTNTETNYDYKINSVNEIVKSYPHLFGTGENALENYLLAEVDKSVEAAKHLKPRSLGEVVILITVPGFPTMEFNFAKQLAKDKRKNRQEWLGLTEEQEKDNQHTVLVRTLANLLREEPLNVPEWNLMKGDLPEKFVNRFIDEENETFIEQLNTLYSMRILPNEFYKSRSE